LLRAGVDQDAVALDANQRAVLSLTGGVTFGSAGGTVRVNCQSFPDAPIHAYWVKLTAIRASGITLKAL